jgi:hypothetical protein
MDCVKFESLRFFCPWLADSIVGRETFEGLEPAGKVAGVEEAGITEFAILRA